MSSGTNEVQGLACRSVERVSRVEVSEDVVQVRVLGGTWP